LRAERLWVAGLRAAGKRRRLVVVGLWNLKRRGAANAHFLDPGALHGFDTELGVAQLQGRPDFGGRPQLVEDIATETQPQGFWVSPYGRRGRLAFLSPPLANNLLTVLEGLGVVSELSLMLWLLVMAVNAQRWTAQAGAAGAPGI
jgi:hypothetical protein